jgi:hypothetical protein
MTVDGYIAQMAVIGAVKTEDFTMFIIEQVVCTFLLPPSKLYV